LRFFQLSSGSTIRDLKDYIAREKLKFSDINRQELRLEPKGKALKDESTLKELDIQNGAMLYFKVSPGADLIKISQSREVLYSEYRPIKWAPKVT